MALPGDTISIEEGYYRNNNHKGVLGLESAQNALHAMATRVLNFQEKVKSPATIEMKKEAKHIIEEKNE